MQKLLVIVALIGLIESSPLERKNNNSTSNILAKLTKDLLPDVGDEDRQYTWNQLVFDELIR